MEKKIVTAQDNWWGTVLLHFHKTYFESHIDHSVLFACVTDVDDLLAGRVLSDCVWQDSVDEFDLCNHHWYHTDHGHFHYKIKQSAPCHKCSHRHGPSCMFGRVRRQLLVLGILLSVSDLRHVPLHLGHQQILSQVLETTFPCYRKEKHLYHAIIPYTRFTADVRSIDRVCRLWQGQNPANNKFRHGLN